jgi:hypothetical protein
LGTSNGVKKYTFSRLLVYSKFQPYTNQWLVFRARKNNTPTAKGNAPMKLMDQVRAKIRYKQYSLRTEQTDAEWVRRYIFFRNKRHPSEMGAAEIESFLTHLAAKRKVSASTQN